MNNATHQIAVFGGGCFWCTEAIFNSLKGIISAVPGYTGGTIVNPSYEQVSAGNTGHVEAVKIEYDPTVIAYEDLMAVFFNTHDPTTWNRQGNDVGAEYRSAIFYTTAEQMMQAGKIIQELNNTKSYEKPVVTEIRPLEAFYPAEDYHQRYYESHKDAPYCQIIIAPKLEKLEKRFKELLHTDPSLPYSRIS